MRFSFILFGVICLGAFATQAQENSGRLSVSPATSPTNAAPATPTQPPAAKAPEPTSNVVDAPLPEIANQPQVITPSKTTTPDGPKGPRDGRWYVAGGAGAMLQQTISSGTATSVGNPPLDQTDSGNLGFYAEGKVGYDFAVRDVQLAF